MTNGGRRARGVGEQIWRGPGTDSGVGGEKFVSDVGSMHAGSTGSGRRTVSTLVIMARSRNAASGTTIPPVAST
jgi:hypothetical protein